LKKEKKKKKEVVDRSTFKKKCNICGHPLKTRETCRKHWREKHRKK
jgi:hypothetical protein